ncbi:MAG: hypothetical protein M3421_01695 [Bacteroidota bacterium]|nr:hypothetical protein [Bacteroidota bacterium]
MIKRIFKVRVALILLFIIFYNRGYSQNSFTLINNYAPDITHTYKERNLVTIVYENDAIKGSENKDGKKRKRHKSQSSIIGNIIHINDSTLTIKKSLSKKRLDLDFDEIILIKKEPAGKHILMTAIVGSIYGVSMFAFNIPPHFSALIVMPPLKLLDLAYPYQKIQDYYIDVNVLPLDANP